MNSREPTNDFDKELRTHLDLEAEEQSRVGTSEREAKDRARRAFETSRSLPKMYTPSGIRVGWRCLAGCSPRLAHVAQI